MIDFDLQYKILIYRILNINYIWISNFLFMDGNIDDDYICNFKEDHFKPLEFSSNKDIDYRKPLNQK